MLFWGIERVDSAFFLENNHHCTKDPVLQTLAVCTYCLQRVTEIFDSAGLILTESEADLAAKALEDHLTSYAWLAARDYQRRVLRFKTRTKAHYLWHVSQEIKEFKLNQNLHHTFQEESFLGKIQPWPQSATAEHVPKQYFNACFYVWLLCYTSIKRRKRVWSEEHRCATHNPKNPQYRLPFQFFPHSIVCFFKGGSSILFSGWG